MDFEEKDCRKNADGDFICPKCFDHPQGSSSDFYDCKNLIFHEGFFEYEGEQYRRHSQCMCYSVAHGEREER